MAQTVNAGDLGSIPGAGRSPEEGNGYPLQYSGLGNSMDCIVHGVANSQTRLSKFHFASLTVISQKWKENVPDKFHIRNLNQNHH